MSCATNCKELQEFLIWSHENKDLSALSDNLSSQSSVLKSDLAISDLHKALCRYLFPVFPKLKLGVSRVKLITVLEDGNVAESISDYINKKCSGPESSKSSSGYAGSSDTRCM